MVDLNLHHLHLFWVLAKEKSFTQAAQSLSISQSAITIQVKALEKSLGIDLLDRSNRKNPSLTEEGKKVLDYADSIFNTASQLLDWARFGGSHRPSHVRIGAVSGFSRVFQYDFLKPVLNNKKIRLEVHTGDQEKLVSLLKSQQLDVVLALHAEKESDESHFRAQVIRSSPYVFVIKKEEARTGKSLSDYLNEKPLYLPDSTFDCRIQLDQFIKNLGNESFYSSEIDDVALLRILAIESGAVVAIPKVGVGAEIKSKKLQIIAELPEVVQNFYALTRIRDFSNSIVDEMIHHIREVKL